MLDVLQCGKSAAIYACATEQGFTVIEVRYVKIELLYYLSIVYITYLKKSCDDLSSFQSAYYPCTKYLAVKVLLSFGLGECFRLSEWSPDQAQVQRSYGIPWS